MAPYDDTLNNSKNSVINRNGESSDRVEGEVSKSNPKISEIVKLSVLNLQHACKVHGCDINTIDCAVNVCKVNEGSYLYNLCLRELKVDHKELKLENVP